MRASSSSGPVPPITVEALLRRSRPQRAIADTSPLVMPDYLSQGIASGDLSLANALNTQIEPVFIEKRLGSRVVRVRRRQLVLTPRLKRKEGRLFWAVVYHVLLVDATMPPDDAPNAVVPPYVDTCFPPDPVLERELSDGRRVYLHSFLSRLAQRMFLLTVGPWVDRQLLPCAHAYRPGRSWLTALAHARQLIRGGHIWAVNCDVRKFFRSISVDLVAEVLAEAYPWMSYYLRRFAVWHCLPNVVRRGEGLSPPPRHILEGSVIAPLLSNIVADWVLDRPFAAEARGAVVMVRFADDILLLARTPRDADVALHRVECLLAGAGLRLHPDKGTRVPVDLTKHELPWLGKSLAGGQVRTPDEVVASLVEAVLDTEPGSRWFKQAVRRTCTELGLDRRGRLDFVERQIRRRSKRHAEMFNVIARAAGPPMISLPDVQVDEVYDQADAVHAPVGGLVADQVAEVPSEDILTKTCGVGGCGAAAA